MGSPVIPPPGYELEQNPSTITPPAGYALEKPEKPEKTGFFGRIGENLNPMPLLRAMRHPYDAAVALSTPDEEKVQEAANAYKQGNYGRMALSTAEAIPMLGRPIRQAEEDISKGDYGALAGTVASALIPKGISKLKGKIPIPNSLNPVEQSAVSYAAREGIPVDLGTATGNKAVNAVQGLAEKQPFMAHRAQQMRQAQEVALQSTGNRLTRSIAPTGTADPVAAGEGVQQAVQGRVQRLNAAADKSYQELRDIAAQPQNTRQVQLGTTQIPGPNPAASLTPAGMPITVPNMQSVQLPIDYAATKAVIRPIVEQLEKSLPEAQRQASPGFTALRQVIDRPDAVDMNTAMKDLSAIQNIARLRDELPEVRGVSKGLAASAIPQLRSSIDTAVAGAGPRATQALERGRQFTKEKYSTNDVLRALPDEPARLVQRLASGGDTNVNLLRDLQAKAPKALPSVARSTVESIVDDMMYQGDVRKAQTAVRAWHNIGDQTKAILFPDPAIRQNITDYVNFAELMTRKANPSGSATTLSALIGAFHPKLLAAQILAGKPVSELLFGGGGAQIAQQGIPVGLSGLAKPAAAVVGANVLAKDAVPQFSKGGVVAPRKDRIKYSRRGLFYGSPAAIRAHKAGAAGMPQMPTAHNKMPEMPN